MQYSNDKYISTRNLEGSLYMTELEELNFYNLKQSEEAAEFLKNNGELTSGSVAVYAFRTMHGLGNHWFAFVNADAEGVYRIHLVIYEMIGLDEEEIKWWDSIELGTDGAFLNDVPSYLEEFYQLYIHQKNGK